MSDDYSASINTTGTVAVGGTATGDIGSDGDRDWFAVELVAGRSYMIDLRGRPTGDGTLSDPYLRGIYDADGNLISGTTNDDGGAGYNSRVTFTASESGTHYIAAGAYSSYQGTYEVEVTDNSPPETQEQVVDEPPAFVQQAYAFDLAENADGSATRVSLGTVSAADPEGAVLSYSIESDNGSGLFEIDAASGELFYVGSGEDYELGSTQSDLTVRASDGDQSIDTSVTVNVTDVDEPAVVDPPVVLPEVSLIGVVVDPDEEDLAADTSTDGRVAVGDTATGNIGSGGDRDWFAVELEAGRTYTIDLRGRPTDNGTLSDPYLYGIHDADGNLISRTRNDDGGEGYNSQVTFTATGSGTYYISAGAFGTNTGTYELEVTDNSPPDVPVQPVEAPEQPVEVPPAVSIPAADTAEADLSGRISTTGTVPVGGSVSGAIGVAGDKDAYAVELIAGRTYRIDLEGSPTGMGTLADPSLRWLRAADGTGIRGTRDDDGGEGANARQEFTPEESGTYYISARANGDGTGTYTLTVTDTSVPELPMMQVENTEATEGEDAVIVFLVTLDQAASGPVTVHYATADGTAVAGQDFQAAQGTLTFAAGETVKTVEVTLIDDAIEDSGETFRLLLSDPSGAELADSEAVGTILNTETAVSEPLSGDLPADTTTTGVVPVGGSATGNDQSPSDVDWFRMTLEAGQTYQIDLEGRPTGQGSHEDPIIAGVFDSFGREIPHTQNQYGGEGANARLFFQPETDGTYYVGIDGGYQLASEGQQPATGTYRLSVTDVTADEIPANTSTGASVAVGGTATGEIEAGGDQNWFRVELTAGTTYLIEQKGIVGYRDGTEPDAMGNDRFRPGNAGLDWRADDGTDYGTLLTPLLRGIHDSSGNLIDGTQGDLETRDQHHSNGARKVYYDSEVEFTPGATGTYYISAGSLGYAGTYELSVEK